MFDRLCTLIAFGLAVACTSTPAPAVGPSHAQTAEPVEDAPEEISAPVGMVPIDLADVAGFSEDPLLEALPALQRSCKAIVKRPGHLPVGKAPVGGCAGDWERACLRIIALQGPSATEDALRKTLAEEFSAFRVRGPSGEEGVFTGYYQSTVKGARSRSAEYSTPIYGKPRDLMRIDLSPFGEQYQGQSIVARMDGGKLRPYFDRTEIEEGALRQRAKVIAWADNPVDAFILHVQGSGIVELNDGGVMYVGYAASNGHSYTGIGRLMLERGLIGEGQGSMPAIREWLLAHPEQARDVMRENARYIFFAERKTGDAIGSQGVPLVPGRSLAIDPKHVPLGAPVFLQTNWPGGGEPLNRLVVAQDTGAAIVGEIRGDLFWGAGDEAFQNAGRMKERGRIVVFLPKPAVTRPDPRCPPPDPS